MAADPIERYLSTLRRRLPADSALSEQTVAEAERELRAAAARIEAGGSSPAHAAAEAVARVPRAEAIAARFALDAPSTSALGASTRLLLSVVVAAAVLLSLAAGSAVLSDPARGWAAASGRFALAAACLLHGALSLRRIWSGGGRSLVLLGGLGLLLLGAAQLVSSLEPADAGAGWAQLSAGAGLAVAIQGGFAAWIARPKVWSPWL